MSEVTNEQISNYTQVCCNELIAFYEGKLHVIDNERDGILKILFDLRMIRDRLEYCKDYKGEK
jgi:hypothetical protein